MLAIAWDMHMTDEWAARLCDQASACARTGEWHRGQSLIDEALQLLGPDAEVQHRDLWMRLMERRAWILFRENRLCDAQVTALDLLPKLDENQSQDAALLAAIYNTLGGIAYQEGHGAAGMSDVERSIEFYERAGDKSGLATARMNHGVLLLTAGRWSEAAQELTESDRLRYELPDQTGRSSILVNLGLLELSLGEHDNARAHLGDSLAMSKESGESHVAAHAQLGLAYLEWIEARIDDADKYVDAALARDERMCGDDRVQAEWLKALIECERGATVNGLARAANARKMAQESSLVDCEADCCRALGIAHLRSKEYDAAHDLLVQSALLAQRASDPYRHALALLEISTVCHEVSLSNAEEAARWSLQGRNSIEEAAKVFAQLGAKRDLARAESVRAHF